MWFKGVLVLSCTALLVTPTNAAFQHKDEVLGKRDSLTARRYSRLNKRQQPWSNQTTVLDVPQTQSSDLVEPETSTPVVIVPTSTDLQSTSVPQDEASSTSQVPTTSEAPTASEVLSTSEVSSKSLATTSEVPTTSEASITSSIPTTTDAPLTETQQQTSAVPTSSKFPKPGAKQPQVAPIEGDGSETTSTADALPSSEITLSIPSSTVAVTTEPSSTAIPETTNAATSEATSSAEPSATEGETLSNSISSVEPSTTAAHTTKPVTSSLEPSAETVTSKADTTSEPLAISTEGSQTVSRTASEATDDITSLISSSARASTSNSADVPPTATNEPVLPIATETSVSSHTRTRTSEVAVSTEPTPSELSTHTDDRIASATDAKTSAEQTSKSVVEESSNSQITSGATETSQAAEPTTTSFEAIVTSASKSNSGAPDKTAAPSLPEILPISSIISDIDEATSAIKSIVSSAKSDIDHVPSAVSSVISSVKSDVEALPSDISSIISSVVSSVKSGVDALPTDISSVISSAESVVDNPPVKTSISSHVLTSVKPAEPTVPASETASSLSGSSTILPIPTSTGEGISHSGASGTGAAPSATATDGLESASAPATTAADATSVKISDATSSAILSKLSDLPSFSLFDPSAVPTSASTSPSDLASTEISASETQVSPTPTGASPTSGGETSAIETSVPASETSATSLPAVSSGTGSPTLASTAPTAATDLTTTATDASIPTLVPTSETSATISSGSSDQATLVPTSNLGVSLTSGASLPTGITTSASIAHPTDPALTASTVSSAVKIDTLESQVPIDAPVPTSESITNTETSASNGEQSPIPTATGPTATATGSSSADASAQASSDQGSGTAAPSEGPTDSGASAAPAETSAQLGPPPTIPTGFDSNPAAKPSASSTEAPLGGAGGEDKPPPLSKSQTAGIAVGGTTCLLIALVAALFLARRYHSNMSNKRHSTGDVYPEMAYIYDPPAGGNGKHDAEAGGAVPAPTMSGAAGGALSRSLSSASAHGPAGQGASAGGLTRSVSKASSYRHSIGPVYNAREQTSSPAPLPRESRYSTGSYLSTGPWDPSLALNAAAAASSVSLNQYKDEAAQNPFRDPEEPKPVANRPPMGGTVKGPLTINPYAFNSFHNNPASQQYPPMSPYGKTLAANRSSSPVRNRASERQSDPFADPFEHDLILNVDLRTATDNSITVLAPPPTPRSGGPAPARGPSPNPYEFRPPPAPYSSHFPGRDSDSESLIPEPLTVSGRNTPEGRRSPMPRESPDSQRTLVQPPPAHVGPQAQDNGNWEDNRVDHPSDVPAPLFPKKPLPLRRQPTLAGPGQALLASTGLPLTIKRKPMGNDSVSGVLDVPRNHHLSPSPTPTQADFSDDPAVQRKRSGEMMFADPALVGRQF